MTLPRALQSLATRALRMQYRSATIVLSDAAGDANARIRLGMRWAALTGRSLQLEALPIDLLPEHHHRTTVYAGRTLLDGLLATLRLGRKPKSVTLLINGAPRDGKWPNGVPFCYFWWRGHLIVTTFEAFTLRMVRRHLGITHVWKTDVRTVMDAAQGWGEDLSVFDVEFIETTQFRSLWYQLLLALYLREHRPVPATRMAIPMPEGDDGAPVIDLADEFGNYFVGSTRGELGLQVGQRVKIDRIGSDGATLGTVEVHCIASLHEVELRQPALVLGPTDDTMVQLVVGCVPATEYFRLPTSEVLVIG